MQPPSIQAFPTAMQAQARFVANALRSDGAQAWVVGGSVRDVALGRSPGDLDLATDAVPDRVERLFERTKGVGRAFGTMLVIVEGNEVEVTTFRADGRYSDGRRPDSVAYSKSLEEDALRRDFTINALYLDPVEDRVVDPTGGLADLAERRLRTVGEPRERFREDALRILRLARFASAYDLDVEPATLAGAQAEVGGLAALSPERVLRELERAWVGSRAARAASLLHAVGALSELLGDPSRPRRSMDRRLAALESLGSETKPASALSVMLPHSDADALRSHLQSMRSSKALREAVLEIRRGELQLELATAEECDEVAMIRTLRVDTGRTAAQVLLARNELGERPLGVVREWMEKVDAMSREDLFPDPLLTADDLLAAGVPRGPDLGRYLQALESEQLAGAVISRAQALAWVARSGPGSGPLQS